MKPAFALAGILSLGVACGGAATASPSPSASRPASAAPSSAAATTAAPTTAPTRAPIVLKADLKASNEIDAAGKPAVTDAEASGSGTATVTIVTTVDASGKLTGATATFVIDLKGFPAATPIILAHIHEGAATVNGGVKVDSGLKAAEPVVLTTGATTITKASLTVDPALATLIIATPGAYYFNVHSVLHPGGVVRGQLTKG